MINNVPVGSYWNKVLRVGPNPRVEGGQWPDVYTYFLTVQCQHCEDPECVKVCPTEASHKLEDGTVQIDKSKCIGCQFCAMACPYSVRYLNEEERVVEKCTLCEQKIAQGELPQCVAQCGARARWFGDLEQGVESFVTSGCDTTDPSYDAQAAFRLVLGDCYRRRRFVPGQAFRRKRTASSARRGKQAVVRVCLAKRDVARRGGVMELQWPLILFTVLVAWSAGLFGAQSLAVLRGDGGRAQMPALVASVVLLAVGGIAVFFHLEHWERIFNGFGHLTSGITQELIAIVVVVALMVVYFVFLRKGSGVPKWLAALSLAMSVVLVAVMAHSYTMAARPAWDSVLWIAAVLGEACVLGPVSFLVVLAASSTMAAARPRGATCHARSRC